MSLGAWAAKETTNFIIEADKQGLLEKVRLALSRKNRVLVLGSTGVGKSNLLRSLEEAMPEAIHTLTRTEFVEGRHLRILKTPFEFIDTPGQELHKSRRSAAIREQMGKGKVGVINVVSYGYHEYSRGKDGVFDGSGVRNEFLEKHRLIEKRALDEWAFLLAGRETTSWVMTVVTKADLWWDRQHEVMEYYHSGSYIDSLKGYSGIPHIVIPYCSVLHRFFGEGSLAGNFDDSDRARLRTQLFEQLAVAATTCS